MEKEESNKVVMFPEWWDELTEKDWRDMLLLRQRLIDGEIDEKRGPITIDDIRNEAARCLLLNRGLRTRVSDDKYFLLVRQAGAKLDWLWKEEEDGKVSLTFRTTCNLLPRWDRMIGPMSHGGDLIFGEFKDAVTLCRAYDKAMTEEPGKDHSDILKQLAGLLYRNRDTKLKRHVRRLPYDADGSLEQLRRGERLPEWFVWGVYAWFSYFCEYLASGEFIIDGETICFAPVFGGGSDGKSGSDGNKGNLGLNDIALTLAESDVFGGFDDVLHTPLMRVMMKLLHDKQHADEIEKKVKSSRSKSF